MKLISGYLAFMHTVNFIIRKRIHYSLSRFQPFTLRDHKAINYRQTLMFEKAGKLFNPLTLPGKYESRGGSSFCS